MNLVPLELNIPDTGADASGMPSRAASHCPVPAVDGGAALLIDKLKQRPVETPFIRASDFRRSLAVERLNKALSVLAAALISLSIGALLGAAIITQIITSGGQ